MQEQLGVRLPGVIILYETVCLIRDRGGQHELVALAAALQCRFEIISAEDDVMFIGETDHETVQLAYVSVHLNG